MATKSEKMDVPCVSTDNSMNVSTMTRSSIRFRLLQKPEVSLELRNKIPLETANEPRFSQSIRQSERSGGDDADGREISPDQVPELSQKTDLDGQESNQDVLPWRDLQVHSRVRSSPQAGLETMAEFRPARQICENGQDRRKEKKRRKKKARKISPPLRQHGRKRVIPEAPEECQVQTERSQQEDHETDRDRHRQESSQDVQPRRDLQVHRILRSSSQTGLKIKIVLRPKLRKQITSETDNSVSETQRVIPEAPEENRVRTKRSHQADQKLNRLYYLSIPFGRKALAGERSLKPPDMNVSRPVIRSTLMSSHNYQLMVSHLAKSRVTGNLSSVYPQDQKNSTDFIKQEVVSHGSLAQPESCCPTSAADKKLENERPTPKDSWPRGPRRRLSLIDIQPYMERYLDLWATEPNFVEEVTRIAATIVQKAKNAVRNSPVVPSSSTTGLLLEGRPSSTI